MNAANRIKGIITAVDNKTGFKHLNLKSAVRSLIDGNARRLISASTKQATSGSITFESGERLAAILNAVNAKTGQSDSTITAAVQGLVNDYVKPTKLYSFGVLSDLHLQYGGTEYYGGIADFQRALTYLKDKVAFTCISGDLVAWAGSGNVQYNGTTDYMSHYKYCVDNYAENMPIYECAGNHETYPAQGVSGTIDSELWMATTGKQLYYSIVQGDDVFLFLSLKGTDVNDLFADGGLDWLGTMLEANKNKRCFVFQHCPELADRAADPSGKWSSLMEGTSGKAFVTLLKQYPNVVWFHGHTHVTLGVEIYPVSDVDTLGYRSVHIPSLVSPRFYDEQTNTLTDSYINENNSTVWGSTLAEGYIVDVYENNIVLRGINFAAGSSKTEVQLMPEEIYVLDTTF